MMHGQENINEIYLLTKYAKSVLWRVAKCLSYIVDVRCLKVNEDSVCVKNRGLAESAWGSFMISHVQ